MIYLVRHGLDDERYIGGYSNVGLVKEGVEQIKRVRDYIVDNNLTINKIYSSDIERAKETAMIINEQLGKEIIYTRDLREQDKGLLTGVEKGLAYDMYPQFRDVIDVTISYPNGESLQNLYDKVYIYLKNFGDDDVLLVTHRGVINMIYYILTNTKLDMDKEKFGVTHGSLHELNIHKNKIRKLF